jgi:hypothetical protein
LLLLLLRNRDTYFDETIWEGQKRLKSNVKVGTLVSLAGPVCRLLNSTGTKGK